MLLSPSSLWFGLYVSAGFDQLVGKSIGAVEVTKGPKTQPGRPGPINRVVVGHP